MTTSPPPQIAPTVPRIGLLALGLTALAGTGGCVERKMVIRSDPPGALITLDGEETRARTPAERSREERVEALVGGGLRLGFVHVDAIGADIRARQGLRHHGM